MRVSMVVVGLAAATMAAGTLLSGCGGGANAAAPVSTEPATTTSTTTTTTTAVQPTTTTPPPPTTTTTTIKPKPKPTTPKPKPKPKPAPTGDAPCDISDGACIDLSANQSWLLSGGKVSYGPVPITHGRKGWRTPAGTFSVSFRDIDHKSRQFGNAAMPYSVFFNGGIAFHAGSLSQQSHGCIHLSNAAAKMYYNTLTVGATVQVVP